MPIDDNRFGSVGVLMVVRPTRAEQSAVARDQFERFARRVSPSLLRTACLLSGDRGHAEDLLQATLWRTARHWEEIRHAPDAYAHKVLVNLSRDRRRELGRRPSEVRASDVRPEVDLDRTERLLERDAMTHAVRQLPQAQREVLVLRFFLDLSVAQTAAVLGVSQGTVKSHTSRALARMRELLAERPENTHDLPSEVPHAE
jgi:RNA polymerase sigma-70 factor (sigma-E family)